MLPPGQPAVKLSRAFSLVEMLLVLAIVALLGTLLLPGANSLLQALSVEEPDRLVLNSINRAREQALTCNRTVRLSFEEGKQRLVWSNDTGVHQQKLPPDIKVQLLQAWKGSTILLGGQLLETQALPAVRFYPDGTCDAFRVQISRGPAAPQIIVFDPWTCAPMMGTQP